MLTLEIQEKEQHNLAATPIIKKKEQNPKLAKNPTKEQPSLLNFQLNEEHQHEYVEIPNKGEQHKF